MEKKNLVLCRSYPGKARADERSNRTAQRASLVFMVWAEVSQAATGRFKRFKNVFDLFSNLN